MHDVSSVDVKTVISSLSDGIYVCDRDRRITFWSESAEKITGWQAADIVGRQCFDNVLCHVDKDGHLLCGKEHCPLHRAMVTDSTSERPVLAYAQGKDGRRIPLLVSVAPIKNASGDVIGGVETFQDARAMVCDLERAKAIQQSALETVVPDDPRVTFTTHYIPHEIIGGDYYAITKINDDQYGLMLADVMGHGVAAALYTMHLSSLWDRYHHLLANPTTFAEKVNRELTKSLKGDVSFATAVCGLIDLEKQVFRLAGAGGPQVLLTHPDGSHECLETSGLSLALMEDAVYEEVSTNLQEGDAMLLFTDGAVEICDADDKMLGIEGLVDILRKQGYPKAPIQMAALEEELLKYSNAIRLDDDLTLVEVSFNTF